MQEKKNPLLQSVFERKLAEGNESFFLKALNELELTERKLKNSKMRTSEVEPHMSDLLSGIHASMHLLRSYISSFDVMSQDSDFII